MQEQLDHELFGRSMFAHRTHGSCTSSAVFLTTALRALGIPTRMVLGIPLVDGNDQAQLAMVQKGIHHHRVRRTLLQGLSSARGYANHTFNEVFVGGRWVRLNYKTLGQNTLDGNLMGLLTHVNTFNDLSEVPLAATWGKRYALGERDAVFRYGNPYRCEEVSDHFGKFAKVENPEMREHRALTISRAYWADDPRSPRHDQGSEMVVPRRRFRSLLIHGEEWLDDESGRSTDRSSRPRARSSCSKPTAARTFTGRITTPRSPGTHATSTKSRSSSRADEYAKMEPGVEYTLTPRNDVAGYAWKTKGRVTITKPR